MYQIITCVIRQLQCIIFAIGFHSVEVKLAPEEIPILQREDRRDSEEEDVGKENEDTPPPHAIHHSKVDIHVLRHSDRSAREFDGDVAVSELHDS